MGILSRTGAGILREHHSSLGHLALEQRADLADGAINDRLLKKLILEYVRISKELADLNMQKNRFLGMAAHDLRNPLSSIRGFSEVLLEDDSDDETRKEFLEIIHSASNSMLQLLNTLLDVSQIESGKFDINPVKGDFIELCKGRIQINSIIANKKGTKLELTFEKIPEFKFDADRLAQVIDNFISNAIKYSPPESMVDIAVIGSNGYVRFEVRDRGPGIQADEKEKLFGEYQKLSNRPTSGESTTGLGLAITKKIVEAHKGDIGVEDRDGGGSVFYFTLLVSR